MEVDRVCQQFCLPNNPNQFDLAGGRLLGQAMMFFPGTGESIITAWHAPNVLLDARHLTACLVTSYLSIGSS